MQRRLKSFIIILFLLAVFPALSSSRLPLSPQVQCSTAFPGSGKKQVEAFIFEQIQETGIEIKYEQQRQIARNAFALLGEQTRWSQAEKADFWIGVAQVLNRRGEVSYHSHRFEGSDGSIVFQSLATGHILVITPDGGVYRGQLITPLEPSMVQRPVWEADYSGLTKL